MCQTNYIEQIKYLKWTQALKTKDWTAEIEAACKCGNLEALSLFHRETSSGSIHELVC